MILTQKYLKFIFYTDRHGLTRIDLVDSVFIENDILTQNNPKLISYPDRHGLTCIDPVGLVLMKK